ncbi:MAG: hypothetical protein ACOZNI_23995 [Myxococcota bacterium]
MRLARRLALFVVGTLASLAGAEVAARGLWPDDGSLAPGTLDARTQSCAQRHPTRGWIVAGRCGRDDRGLLTGAPTGGRRLLLVGDSVAEGEWANALARRLGVTLLNAATSGYNTCQEAVALAELVASERPDAVLLQTCPNDHVGSAVVLPDGAWSSVAWDGGWRRVPTLALRSRLVQIAIVARSTATQAGELGDRVARCARAAVAAAYGVPMAVLHFPALVDPDETDARLVALRAEEARMREVWAPIDVAQVDGRAALAGLGPLARLTESDADRIHPRRDLGPRIGDALAGPVAEALGR